MAIGSQRPRLCTTCLSTRSYAVAATSLKTLTPEPNSHLPHLQSIPPVTASTSQYETRAGILLSRPPLLTRPPTAFEEAYFFYQKRLHERLALPFSRYFYYKADTPADTDYKFKAKARGGAAARELGSYTGYGEEAWNDELLVGDKTSSKRWEREALVKDAKMTSDEGAEEIKEVRVEKRHTESDRKRDETKLDRKLARTVYLVVRGADGRWRFPSGGVVGRENLVQVCLLFPCPISPFINVQAFMSLALELKWFLKEVR